MPCFTTIKSFAEFIYFLTGPILVFFAWKMLGQLKIGSDQVKTATEQIITSKKISQIHAKRDSIKIATEQANIFAEKIAPEMNKFYKLKNGGKYPILLKSEVIEDLPNIQCNTNDLPGLIKEIESNDGLALNTLNQLEGLAMFFVCGVADTDTAYRPLSATFCNYIKIFLPYIVVANDRLNHFHNILRLYVMWSMKIKAEQSMKEITKHKEHLSKIKVPEIKPFGTEDC